MFRAKGKLFSFLTACFALLLTLVMGVATMNLQPKTASAAETTVTLNVYGKTGNLSGSTITWTDDSGVVTFSNTKGSTAIRTSDSDHYRVYSGSTGFISADGAKITKVVITATSSEYASVCQKSFNAGSVSGSTVTISGLSSNEVTFKSTAQWRLKKIAVTYEVGSACEHANQTTKTTDALCTTAGSVIVTCDDCGEEISKETIPATGHVNTTTTTVDADCTTNGSVVVICDDCGATVSSETIEALGHDFGDEVTYEREGNQHTEIGTCNTCGEQTTQTEDCTLSYEYEACNDKTHDTMSTCSVCQQSVTKNEECTFDDGVLNGTTKTYTCEYCEYSYTEEVPVYTVTYSVPNGVELGESSAVVEQGSAVVLPTPGELKDYSFAGWVTGTYNNATEINETIYKGEEVYTPDGDITLKALYLKVLEKGGWSLLKDVSNLAVGKEVVIVASGFDYALSTTQNTNNRAQAAVVKNENSITFESGVQILTLKAGTVDGTYAFYTGSGYLYAASGSSNHLKTQTTNNANGSWKITVEDGVATIKAQGSNTRNWLRYNSTNTPPIFSCYSSGQADVSLYIKSEDSYSYTTEGEECKHENADVTTVEPTCTDKGYIHTDCKDCEYEFTEEVDALGHSYQKELNEEGFYVYTCENCAHSYVENLGEWTLLKDESLLKEGLLIVIVSKNSSYAMSTNQKTSNRGQASVTKQENTLSIGDDVQIITLQAGVIEGTYAFYTGSGYLYAASNSSNELKTQKTKDENGSWLITIGEDGVATIQAQGTYERNTLQYNSNNSLFSCYASDKAMQEVQIYYSTAKVGSASVTIGDDVALNYYVSMSTDLGAENVEMRFTQDGAEVDTIKGMLCEDGRYKFSLTLPPQRMADVFTVEVIYNDTIIATQEEYSVQAYATKQLAKSDITKELKQLIVDMLHYGAAAQEYKEYNSDALATNGLGEDASDFAMPEAIENWYVNNTEISSYPAYFTNVGVWFDYNNQIYVTLNTAQNVKITVNGAEVAVEGTRVLLGGILATEYGKKFEIKLYSTENGEEVLMQTLTYSVNFYVYQICKKNANEKMVNLAKALYCYGQSAVAYQNSKNAQGGDNK